jgi:hypothetical protein
MREEVILRTEVQLSLREGKQHGVEEKSESVPSSYLFFIE